MMKTQMKMALLGAAVVLPLSTVAFQANATAIAYSAQQISNFLMTGVAAGGGFDTFEFNSNPLTVSLNGASELRNGGTCSGSAACVIDLAPIAHSAGITPGFLTNNDYFTTVPSLNNPAGDYAVSDSNMLNAAITSGSGGVFGAMAGAQKNGDSTGSANTGTENTMFWNFNVSSTEISNAGGAINLSFSYDYLAALFLQTNLPLETASGSIHMFVELLDENGEVISSIVSPYNQTISITSLASPTSATLAASSSDHVTVNNAFTITAEGNYGINIKFDNRVNVHSQVPEPATLALLGLGVLGLGAVRRRKAA